jgi:replicative DNA helicase
MLPTAITAEEAVLGAIIDDNETYDLVSPYLKTEIFYKNENKALWNKITSMKKGNRKIDMVTLCSALEKEDKEAGLDAYYITGLSGNATGSEWAIIYAKEVYEKYLLRLVVSKSTDIQEIALSNSKDVYSVLGQTHSLLSELMNLQPGEKFDIDNTLMEALDSIDNSGKNLIKFGIQGLDELSGGMTRGELTIVGGRPGHGKTTMTVNLLKNFIDQGLKVALFNREMTNIEMIKKIIALESGKLSYGMIRQGIHDKTSYKELINTMNEISRKYNAEKFVMFDNIRDFAGSSAEVKKFKPDVIIDDYLQLISPANPEEQRRLQLEKIVNDYKWLAKSTNACAILVSQLNRSIESRGNGKPQLSDLAESGAIEQVAENVIFSYYDYKINYAKSKTGPNCIEAIGSKVRYGTSGSVKMGYDGDKAKLYSSIEEYRNSRS